MEKKNLISRRQLFQRSSAALFPLILPSSVFGAAAPSNRITVGMIGVGRQGVQANLPAFLGSEDTRVTAVCDVDGWRLDKDKIRHHHAAIMLGDHVMDREAGLFVVLGARPAGSSAFAHLRQLSASRGSRPGPYRLAPA